MKKDCQNILKTTKIETPWNSSVLCPPVFLLFTSLIREA